ncbi:MAG TPA: 2,3-diphosphoglycerate-dependent phosphoglycerate mutase [Acidimicrobiia bacterium]|nr:2,3-diphosphoglycerate-dependent phosphoglycerate mutase [Acidimicrobiia bacterium]
MSHILILLRHGQSEWNLSNLFTGWTDVGLTGTGEEEAREAGRLMAAEGLKPDVMFTSVLKRATATADLALEAAGWTDIPTERHWRLNERHYGSLQGLNKKETAEKYGDEQVLIWRRSYGTPPPALELDDERHPSLDPLYADIEPSDIPSTEALSNVVDRMLPYWFEKIVPELEAGKTVLVVAHGNSLRALIKHLDDVSEEDIVELNIPTGIPLVYELDDEMKPISSRYLGDAEAAQAAAEAVGKQAG